LSTASISARAATASVEPVSPSPDLASNAFSSASNEINSSQLLIKKSSCGLMLGGQGHDRCQPIGSATTFSGVMRLTPGHAANGVAAFKAFRSAASAGKMDTENPRMSNDVIMEDGPMM
jgi:phage-related minor tail protein